MAELEFRTEPHVQLIAWMGDDRTVAQRARVSTKHTDAYDGSGLEYAAAYIAKQGAKDHALVRRLITDRHGTPAEHVVFTHDVETSIFVAREFLRHRMASYSEASLRYMEGQPVVYVPGPERHLIQKPGSKQMDYETELGNPELRSEVSFAYQRACKLTWNVYRDMLEVGVLREVARGVLPLCFGTHFHVTWNARSVMNFLSLRIEDPDADRVSHPQYEIVQVAKLIEATFAERLPVLYESFIANGRRTP